MAKRDEMTENRGARAAFPMMVEEAQAVQARFAAERRLPETLVFALGGGVILALQLIPTGDFLMGSAPGTAERSEREGPLHRVKMAQPFYMGQFPVTQGQWQAVMGENPAHFAGGGALPMETISWRACATFCEALSEQSGRKVRLPSEAEWEYGCRAGNAGIFNFGEEWSELPVHAWYRDNAGGQSHPV